MPISRHARTTRTAISPRLATSSFLIFIRPMILLIAKGLHRGLDERGVDDVLERNGRLDETVALPPHHLALDVFDPEPPAAILVRQSELDHRLGRAGVARGDCDDFVVGAARLAGESGIVVIPRRLDVPLHEAHRARTLRRELLRVEHRRDLPRKQVAAPRDHPSEPAGLGAAGKRLVPDPRVELLAVERAAPP